MAASHFLLSGPNSAIPIRRRIGARIRTGRNARRPASSSSPSAVPSASLHTPPLLSQAVRRNAHMPPIRRSVLSVCAAQRGSAAKRWQDRTV